LVNIFQSPTVFKKQIFNNQHSTCALKVVTNSESSHSAWKRRNYYRLYYRWRFGPPKAASQEQPSN